MSSTDELPTTPYRPTHSLRDVQYWYTPYGPTIQRMRYGLSGTGVGYAASPCAVLTQILRYQDTINGEFKYIFLSAGSSLKGQSDREKFEKVRAFAMLLRQTATVCAIIVAKLLRQSGTVCASACVMLLREASTWCLILLYCYAYYRCCYAAPWVWYG